jgi:hypothetical protein
LARVVDGGWFRVTCLSVIPVHTYLTVDPLILAVLRNKTLRKIFHSLIMKYDRLKVSQHSASHSRKVSRCKIEVYNHYERGENKGHLTL